MTPRRIRLVGGKFDGGWFDHWQGESAFIVRQPFIPDMTTAQAMENMADEAPIATMQSVSENYVVYHLFIECGSKRIAFAAPANWTDTQAMYHLFGEAV